jgi:hypothetical protein
LYLSSGNSKTNDRGEKMNSRKPTGTALINLLNTAFCLFSLIIFFILSFCKTYGQTTGEEIEDIHRPYDILLQLYVSGTSFDYDRMWRNEEDLERLSDYIDTLENITPSDLPEKEALAYWINLYNAATLESVFKHYPIESIKDIGGFLKKSPWNRKVVKVAGRELALNEIENDIIRKQFNDARIHLALNCASIGCPPLRNRAYLGDKLDEQLDEACNFALNDERWVKITDQEIRVSKIFDWYKDDFKAYAGSVREFIAKYRETDREAIMDDNRQLEYMDYNWDLNKVVL